MAKEDHGYTYRTHSDVFVHTTETTWPNPYGERLSNLERRLRYGKQASLEDRVLAASVIHAYRAVIDHSEKSRRRIVAARYATGRRSHDDRLR